MKTYRVDKLKLKDWIIAITEGFWEKFKDDTDLSFTKKDSKKKLTQKSQKIIDMIRTYLENLIKRATKLEDIPEVIKEIIYNYIKDKTYFPKRYLKIYQITRIDFNFYGETKNLDDAQVGMLLALLIISRVTVKNILFNMKDIFVEFKKYKNIDKTANYIGSIMHYLTSDTFNNNPSKLKKKLALMNYYRNYHIYNSELEPHGDNIFNDIEIRDEDKYEYGDNIFNDIELKDEDEDEDEYFGLGYCLIDKSSIIEFWNLDENADFIKFYKNDVYSWACKLGKSIRLKYQKYDKNLLPRKKLNKPKDKTFKIKSKKEKK